MRTLSFDPLTRFLIVHTIVLALGLITSAIVRRRFGASAATLLQRITLAAVGVLFALMFAPTPALNVPILPPVTEYNVALRQTTGSVGYRARKAYPPVPVLTSFSDREPDIAINFPSRRMLATAAFGGVWALGVVAGIVAFAFASGRLRRALETAEPVTDEWLLAEIARAAHAAGYDPPAARRSPGSIPFVTGVARPILYLPSGDFWDRPSLRAALAHEMHHLVRCDLQWSAIMRICRLLLWFQPLIWLLQRQMERVAEEDCDEAALRQGVSPLVYADLLFRLSDFARPPIAVAAGMANFRSQAGQRIAHLLEGKPMSSFTSRRRALALSGGIVSALCIEFAFSVRLTPVAAQETVPLKVTEEPGLVREMAFDDAVAVLDAARHRRGPESAPVAVVEFTDFACPSCRKASEFTQRLGTTPQIQFAVIHRPLEAIHPDALSAAVVSEAEGSDKRFWSVYADLMQGRRLDSGGVRKRYERLGQDARRYTESKIRVDIDVADRQNVRAVPTYFILDRIQKKAYRVTGSPELQKMISRLAPGSIIRAK